MKYRLFQVILILFMCLFLINVFGFSDRHSLAMTQQALLENQIRLSAREYDSDYHFYYLVRSIIHAEIGGRLKSNGKDFEKSLYIADWYRKNLTEKEKADILSYYSIGLCRVTLGIAKALGFKGDVRELFDPKTNLKYCCLYLKELSKRRNYKLTDIISAYNQGYCYRYAIKKTKINISYDEEENIVKTTNVYIVGWNYCNYNYVQKAMKKYNELKNN